MYEIEGALRKPNSPATTPSDVGPGLGSENAFAGEWQVAHDCPIGFEREASKKKAWPSCDFVVIGPIAGPRGAAVPVPLAPLQPQLTIPATNPAAPNANTTRLANSLVWFTAHHCTFECRELRAIKCLLALI